MAGQAIEAAGAPVTARAGETPALDVIFARRVLMGSIDVYMQEIEAFVEDALDTGEPIPFEAAEAADIVSSMLLAFPHLFPSGTDIWSEEAEAEDPTSVSLALPAIWERFPDFYERANEAAQQAFDLSRARPRDEVWMQAAADLRSACDSCHADYTRFRPLSSLEPPEPLQD